MVSGHKVIFPLSSSLFREHCDYGYQALQLLIFFETVSDDYGVSVDDPPTLESDSVTVPEGQFHLQPEELAELQDSVNPLQEVTIMGQIWTQLYWISYMLTIHKFNYTTLFCIVLWNQFYPKYSPWFPKISFVNQVYCITPMYNWSCCKICAGPLACNVVLFQLNITLTKYLLVQLFLNLVNQTTTNIFC